jgi:predicted DNA-binding transcriptional regulator AlpA
MQANRRRNVRDAAAYIGSTKSYMDKLRCYGGGPRYYKIGAKIVYDEADLDAWLAERARSNTSQNPASERGAA